MKMTAFIPTIVRCDYCGELFDKRQIRKHWESCIEKHIEKRRKARKP